MEDEEQKLNNLISKSKRRLLEVSTVFPFDFFPDTIRIDENKIDLIFRSFFYTKHLVPILIPDISTVLLSSSVFFASIHIQLNKPRPPGLDLYLGEPIKYLWKNDAIKTRRVIMGLVIANQQKIDIAQIPTSELITKVEEIGKSKEYTNI
jgi:hypothetical protein